MQHCNNWWHYEEDEHVHLSLVTSGWRKSANCASIKEFFRKWILVLCKSSPRRSDSPWAFSGCGESEQLHASSHDDAANRAGITHTSKLTTAQSLSHPTHWVIIHQLALWYFHEKYCLICKPWKYLPCFPMLSALSAILYLFLGGYFD